MECGGSEFNRSVCAAESVWRAPITQTLVNNISDCRGGNVIRPLFHEMIVFLNRTAVTAIQIEMPRQLDDCRSPIR